MKVSPCAVATLVAAWSSSFWMTSTVVCGQEVLLPAHDTTTNLLHERESSLVLDAAQYGTIRGSKSTHAAATTNGRSDPVLIDWEEEEGDVAQLEREPTTLWGKHEDGHEEDDQGEDPDDGSWDVSFTYEEGEDGTLTNARVLTSKRFLGSDAEKKEMVENAAKEVAKELAQNGTVSAEEVMAKLTEELLLKEELKDEKSETYEELYSSKDGGEVEETEINDVDALSEVGIQEGSAEFSAIDEILAEANNHTICEAPGQPGCEEKDAELLEKIFQFITTKIEQLEGNETIPTMEWLYSQLEEEMGISGAVADELIAENDEIRGFLRGKFKRAVKGVQKKKLEVLTTIIEEKMIEASKNGSVTDDAFKDIGLDEDVVAGAMRAVDKKEVNIILKTMAQPQKDLQQQVQVAYKNQKLKNHTSFEEITDSDDDEDDGRRMLRWVPPPGRRSYEDDVNDIHEDMHRRRLSRKLLPKDTTDFTTRLLNHIDDLQEHVRHLKLSCEEGASDTRCVADGFGYLAGNLTEASSTVSKSLSPLDDLLASLHSSQVAMDKVELVARLTLTAVTVAKNIPQIGTVFKVVEQGMKPVHKGLKEVDDKASTFQNSIGDAWDKSIGRIDNLIDSFETGVVFKTIEGANLVATMQESVCVPGILKGITGVDVVGNVEDAISAIKKYTEKFLAALTKLSKAFAKSIWKDTESALKAVVKAIEPVAKFFKPFEILADLITKKITLPWFKPPKKQKRFGKSYCNKGYYKDPFDKQKCWESSSEDWDIVPLSIPPKMTTSCRYGDMTKHWAGIDCNNKKYTRKNHARIVKLSCSKIKIKLKAFKKPKVEVKCKASYKCKNSGYETPAWAPVMCYEKCKSGYTDVLGKCFEKKCVDKGKKEFKLSFDKAVCIKNYKRKQKNHKALCDKYKLTKGTKYIRDILGYCWRSCEKGEELILGQCFPEAKLKLSIKDIFDAVQDIMDFITGLPIVKTIMDAIEKLVGKILKPVTKVIDKWLSNLFKMPTFPKMKIGSLPFSDFDDLDLKMPQMPDFELPNLMAKAAKALPSPLDQIVDCGTDMSCMSQKFGLNVSAMVDPLMDVVGKVQVVGEKFKEVIQSLKCKTWEEKTIPVSELLGKIGIKSDDACDVDMNICTALDTSGIEDVVMEMTELMRPLMDKFLGTEHGRRLFVHGKDSFTPVLGVALLVMGPVWSKGKLDFRTKLEPQLAGAIRIPVSQLKKKEKQPLSFHFRGEPKISIDFGFYKDKEGKPKFAVEFSGGIELRFITTLGRKNMWREAISIANDLVPGADKETEPDQYWEGVHGGECFVIESGSVTYLDTTGDKDKNKRCSYMVDAHQLAEAATNSKPCRAHSMREHMDDEAWLEKNNPIVVECVQHWFDAKNKINKLVKKFHKKKNLQMRGNWFTRGTLDLGYKTRIAELDDKLKIKSEWIFALTGLTQELGSPPANLGNSALGTGKLLWGFAFDGKDYKSKAKLGPRFVFDHEGTFTNRYSFGDFSVKQLWHALSYSYLNVKEKVIGDSLESAKKNVRKNLMSGLADVSGGFAFFAKYSYVMEIVDL